MLRMSEEDWSSVIDTNLTGSFRLAKRAAKGMLRLRRGRIIFISSVVGLLGSAGQVNYAASKAGLVGMARSLARELGSRSITANVVAPGFVETDMTAVLTDDQKATIKTQVPLGRYASPRRDRRGGDLAGLRRRGLRHRRGDPRRRRTRHGPLTTDDSETTDMGILDGKRILVAGVTMDSSIGFATAKVAQEQGATVLISNFGRALGITKRIAKRLPVEPAGARARRDRPRAPRAAPRRWSASTSTGSTGSCTRSPTATPRRCSAASSSTGPWDDVAQAVQVSAYSLKSLATACRPLMGPGGSVVGMTFDATVAWPAYDWMGVAKAAPGVHARATSPATSARRASG